MTTSRRKGITIETNGSHRVQWETKVGPAALIGVVQLIGMILGVGVLYGTFTGQIQNLAINATKAEAAINTAEKEARKRDDKLATQSERLGKIETSVQFIVPAIQRIESLLTKN